MLTESEARDLLAEAADTVEVGPGQPIEKAPRSIWPMLAAAAAVVAIVGTTAAVVDRTSDDTGPPAVDPTTATTSPSPVLAADQIPSVFSYDADSATRLLQSSGLEVTTKPDYTCGTTGRATKTDPAVGARFQPGDAVTLYVTQIPPAARCVEPANEDAAWRFLDFANGRGPAPAFADEVTLYVNGVPKTLTEADAADPDNWGIPSALEALAADSRDVSHPGPAYTTPFLRVNSDDGTQFGCGGQDLPAPLTSTKSLFMYVGMPSDGIPLHCNFVNLFRTDGRIDIVVLRSDAGPAVNAPTEVPEVVGMTEDQARSQLEADGFGVAVSMQDEPRCDRGEIVLRQSPYAGASVQRGSLVRITVNERNDNDCGGTGLTNTGPNAVGAKLAGFARGEIESPPVAPKVDLYVGNEFVKTISREDAADPSAWKVCPAAGSNAAHTCPFSALEPMRQSASVAFTTSAPQHPCVHLGQSLPRSLSDYSFVTAEDAGFTDCTRYYGIQLFVNGADEVVAANVVLAEP